MKRKKKQKNKIKTHLYILAVKNTNEQVTNLIPSHDYNGLQLAGMELAKERKGSWSIYRLFRPGLEIDGGVLTTSWKEIKNGRG